MTSGRIANVIGPGAIAISAISVFAFVHPIVRVLFIPGMIISFILYLLTSYRNMHQPDRVLPIYLVALAW